MLEPDNRVVMISGASRGIGRTITERLLEAGFRISAGVRDVRGLAHSARLMAQRHDAESAASAELLVNCQHEDMIEDSSSRAEQ